MFPRCYNVFMAIFKNYQKTSNYNHARKGAAFSVTMPFEVEHRLREIQKSMGLNSRSQTIVFLVHHYDKEMRTFDSIDKLSKLLEKAEKLQKNDDSKLAVQQNMPYNSNN